MKKFLIGSFILGFLAMSLYADYTPKAKIEAIYTYGNSAIIQLKNANINNSCKHKNVVFIENINNAKALYSSVLSAQMAGKYIRFGYVSTKCSGVWGANSVSPVYSSLLLEK